MKWFTILLLMVLFLPTVVATAPNITSVSLDDGSVIFSSATATVTASDVESNPINYTFATIPGVVFIDTGWTGLDNVGTNSSNPNFEQCSGNGCNEFASANINVTTDYLHFTLSARHGFSNCEARSTLLLNNTVLASITDNDNDGNFNTSSNFTADISRYNDGGNHTLKLLVNNTCALGGTATANVWFDQWYTGNSDTSDLKSVYKQNSSSNAYSFDYNMDERLLGDWILRVVACDNNSECSESDVSFSTPELYNCQLGVINENETIAGAFDNDILNFTVKDVVTNVDLDSELEYSIALSHSNAYNSLSGSFNSMSVGMNSYEVCQVPGGLNLTLDDFVSFLPDLGDYTNSRFYYFTGGKSSTGNSQDIVLYALNNSLASTVTTTVKDAGVGVSNAIVQLLRFDPSTGSTKTAQMCKTGSDGKCNLLAQLNDALYSFVVVQNGVTTLATSAAQIVSTSLTLNLGSGDSDPSSVFRNIQFGVTYDLSYDNNTGNFTCTYSDNDGDVLTTTLLVEEYDITSLLTTGTSSTSASSGTLIVNAPLVNGTTYKATCSVVFPTGESGTLEILTITVPKGEGAWGALGWVMFFVITLVLAFAFIENPMAMLLMIGCSFIFHKMIGAIPIDWSNVVAIFSILFVIAIYTRIDRR